MTTNEKKTEIIQDFDQVIQSNIPKEQLDEINRILYGIRPKETEIKSSVIEVSQHENFEIKSFEWNSVDLKLKEPRRVKIGCIQNMFPVQPCETTIKQQSDSILERMKFLVTQAGEAGVNVLALQEAWHMPFAFCTREKFPWSEFAECPKTGRTITMLKPLAKKYNMVIVSSILEDDRVHSQMFNTAVVISHTGNYIGKTRKNHIPRVGAFNESTYYMEGNLGHPVFDTIYGKIGVVICYGRHHPLEWMAVANNGAEIIVNPSATVNGLSEPLWYVEQRNAAIANCCFTVAINRVGTEVFPNEFTDGDKKPAHKDFGHFYGSSYISAPDGSRTPGLSRIKDGILVCEVDLNQIEVVKHSWGFKMTGRHAMYAKHLTEYVKDGYKQQIITDPALRSNDCVTYESCFDGSDCCNRNNTYRSYCTIPPNETRNDGL